MADVMTPSAQTAVHLYLDIETIPSQDAALIAEIQDKYILGGPDLSEIRASANLKDPQKVAADLAKRREKARDDHAVAVGKSQAAAVEEYRKTCLDATTGHIACIYHSFNDDPIAGTKLSLAPVAASDSGYPIEVDFSNVVTLEREMLQRFFRMIEGEVAMLSKERWRAVKAKQPEYMGEFYDGMSDIVTIPPIVVAHHAAFDLRYIWQRAVILGVPVPAWWPHDAKAWDTTKVQDTMLMWAGVGQRIGLDRLCKALGIEGKGDIDGSKVWDYVREGRIAEVAEYCGDDVERLRAVHRKIVGLPHIGYGFIVEDEHNGGSFAYWDANPPTNPGARDVHRVIEAEFDREELERAEYLSEADAQRAYEDGEV